MGNGIISVFLLEGCQFKRIIIHQNNTGFTYLPMGQHRLSAQEKVC